MEDKIVYERLEGQVHIKNEGYILANKYYHLMCPNGNDVIPNIDVQEVDGKEWEIFIIHSETEKAYYGSRLEGIGLINCMVLKEDTRDFLSEEIEKLNKHHYQLGPIVHKLTIEPIKSKWKKEI